MDAVDGNVRFESSVGLGIERWEDLVLLVLTRAPLSWAWWFNALSKR